MNKRVYKQCTQHDYPTLLLEQVIVEWGVNFILPSTLLRLVTYRSH